MSQYEEAAVIIEKEIEILNNLQKFNRLTCLCIFYHVNRCEQENCTNCSFADKLEYIFTENYPDKVNGTEGLQKFCMEYFGSFFSLTCFLKSLAAVEREREREEKLESKFNNILKV